MNLKKISVCGLFLALVGAFGILTINQASAINVPASGINMATSTMKIVFVEELNTGNNDRFYCLGQTITTATVGNPPVEQKAVTVSFTDLGISLNSSGTGFIDLPANTCFQQAGTYTVTIYLIDGAGNESTYEPYVFEVKATTPSDETLITLDPSCSGKYANGSDECKLSFELRDRFSNPVTQITNAGITLDNTDPAKFTNGDFTDDANTAVVKFISGLSLNDGDPTIEISLSRNLGEFPFLLKALAPSIQKVGTFFATLVERTLDFDIMTFNIEDNGDLGSVRVPISVDPISVAGVEFGHLFEIEPAPGNFVWEGEIETPGEIELTLIDTSGAGPATRTGGLLEKNPYLTYTGVAFDENNPYIIQSADYAPSTLDTHISPYPADGVYHADEIISLVTEITYDVNGSVIQYPAGGTGLDTTLTVPIDDVIGYVGTVAVKIVGADIEGGVIGTLSEMRAQPKTGIKTFNISQSTEKLRDQITENVFRLSRGSSHVISGGVFQESWFDGADVVIVEVEENDVTFDFTSVIPEGNNTLIIKNGNFIVSNHMTYQNANDSFGVILVNTEQNDRAHGNIFVYPTVRTMVGSYYADGGLMTNDKADEDDPTVENSLNSATENTDQLLLTGTLFSQNTLGGSMIVPDDGGYFVPWGTTGLKNLARQYDLHYVRRYQPDLNANDEDPEDNRTSCAPKNGDADLLPIFSTDDFGVKCDTNENAFVIRIDRKASASPPPGFESAGDIVR